MKKEGAARSRTWRKKRKFVKQRLFEMEVKIERMEFEIELCRRRIREMKAELKSGKKRGKI